MSLEKKRTSIPGLDIRQGNQTTLQLFEGAAMHYPMKALSGFAGMHAEDGFGAMAFQYYLGKEFQIWHSDYYIEQPVEFISSGAMEVLELHIPLAGESMGWWDGVRQNNIRAEQFELEYAPFLQTQTTFSAKQRVCTLDVHYTSEFLTGFIEQYPHLETFLRCVQNKKRSQLFNAVRFLHPAMQRIIRDILHYGGPVGQAGIFYEQQAILLLNAVLERARSFTRYSNKQDIDAVMAIRQLVTATPERVFTTDELSQYTGISVSKLHYTFKDLSGVTLFHFTQRVRLEHAWQLLRDTDALIQEIAWTCGYSEHANFTAAFSKRFGITPLQVRLGKIK